MDWRDARDRVSGVPAGGKGGGRSAVSEAGSGSLWISRKSAQPDRHALFSAHVNAPAANVSLGLNPQLPVQCCATRLLRRSASPRAMQRLAVRGIAIVLISQDAALERESRDVGHVVQ